MSEDRYVSIESVGPFPYDSSLWNALTTDGKIVANLISITGSITVSRVIGGSAPDSSLTLQSTDGVGTTDFVRITVGNNGAKEALRAVSSGRIGIGTIAPATNLEVVGGIRINNNGSANALGLFNGTNERGQLAMAEGTGQYATGTVAGDIVLRTAGGKLFFDTNTGSGTPSLTILGTNGNVGVKVAAPAVALDVLGAIHSGLAAELIGTSVALTAGGTANVPTLTAGPVTGNPTKWLPINDNGTTRYVPAW